MSVIKKIDFVALNWALWVLIVTLILGILGFVIWLGLWDKALGMHGRDYQLVSLGQKRLGEKVGWSVMRINSDTGFIEEFFSEGHGFGGSSNDFSEWKRTGIIPEVKKK